VETEDAIAHHSPNMGRENQASRPCQCYVPAICGGAFDVSALRGLPENQAEAARKQAIPRVSEICHRCGMEEDDMPNAVSRVAKRRDDPFTDIPAAESRGVTGWRDEGFALTMD
jgi:hypothetical protein